LRDLVSLYRLYKLFKSQRIDIVHTHTPKCSLLGQLAAKMAGVPIIVNTVHGFYFHDHMKPMLKRFYVLMEKIAAKCSDMILSQNPEDVDTAIRLGICKPDKIKMLGNGVDLGKFNPRRFDGKCKSGKRKEVGLPEDAIVVGIIGRLVKEKGFLELFEATQQLISKHDNLWLVIIGPEDTEKPDHISGQTFRKYGIESRTVWLGKRDDIPELLMACDIYCLPSWREGFPRSAIEAAAMGLPIVTTNIRGCRQVVDDGVNGLLVGLRDAESLRESLCKLIDDGDLRKRFGEAGYRRARTEFDERRVCENVLETYGEFML
jgi:glycosyltransferase involved in cell wall biosynthesis